MRAHTVGVLQSLGHHPLQLSLSRAVAVVREQMLASLVSGHVLSGTLVNALADGNAMLVGGVHQFGAGKLGSPWLRIQPA